MSGWTPVWCLRHRCEEPCNLYHDNLLAGCGKLLYRAPWSGVLQASAEPMLQRNALCFPPDESFSELPVDSHPIPVGIDKVPPAPKRRDYPCRKLLHPRVGRMSLPARAKTVIDTRCNHWKRFLMGVKYLLSSMLNTDIYTLILCDSSDKFLFLKSALMNSYLNLSTHLDFFIIISESELTHEPQQYLLYQAEQWQLCDLEEVKTQINCICTISASQHPFPFHFFTCDTSKQIRRNKKYFQYVWVMNFSGLPVKPSLSFIPTVPLILDTSCAAWYEEEALYWIKRQHATSHWGDLTVPQAWWDADSSSSTSNQEMSTDSSGIISVREINSGVMIHLTVIWQFTSMGLQHLTVFIFQSLGKCSYPQSPETYSRMRWLIPARFLGVNYFSLIWFWSWPNFYWFCY